jgi:hypothetical protein
LHSHIGLFFFPILCPNQNIFSYTELRSDRDKGYKIRASSVVPGRAIFRACRSCRHESGTTGSITGWKRCISGSGGQGEFDNGFQLVGATQREVVTVCLVFLDG